MSSRPPFWLLIPARVLLLTFLLTLLSFAVGLLLGILGTIASAALRGQQPNLTHAYRHIAAPIAIVAASVALISMVTLEIRRYRREKALLAIEQSSRSS